MTAFATFESRTSNRFTVPPLGRADRALRPTQQSPVGPDRAIRQKMEAGLDRLLHDIEQLEDAERWDGMS